MTGTNRITNNLGRIGAGATRDSIAPFNFETLPVFLKNSRKGIKHNIPVSYSFKALKYLTVSPTISYDEKWYFERLDWKYAEDSTFVSDTIPGFNRVANYSFSAGIATRIYGMYYFNNKNSKVKAIRHVVNPSVSFGYTPDFSKNRQYFDTLRNSNDQLVYQDKYNNFVYGGSSLGKSGAIGFGIGNNLEMKVKGAKDTVDRKVMLLNNLSINSSYNLIADSFKLAPIGLAANTNILNNKINVNLSATVDPYTYVAKTDDESQVTTLTKKDIYAWRSGSLGKVTSATLAVSTNLNPQKREKENDTREKIAEAEIPETDKAYLLKNAAQYVDFDIPWSLNINYNLAYNNPIFSKKTITQTVQFSGDVSLTEKWKVTFNSGYHFESKEFTQTNLGISRDLHCWQMNLTWVPFGRFQSYNFTIAVKASILQDLKLEKRRPFLDNL
jgi:hypothetical protein